MAIIKVIYVINDVINDVYNYLIVGMFNCFCYFWRVFMVNCGWKWVIIGVIRYVFNFYICVDSRGINYFF